VRFENRRPENPIKTAVFARCGCGLASGSLGIGTPMQVSSRANRRPNVPRRRSKC